MRKSRFSETQIIDILKDAEAGVAVSDLRGRRVSAEPPSSMTNDAGTRRLTRSVQRPLSDARAKKAWILWKTAKDAVSHRLHTRCLFR